MRRGLQKDEKGRYYLLDEFLKGIPKTVLCTIGVSIDMTEADSFRKKLGEVNNVHVTITPLIIKAAANTLEDFPILCGYWDGDARVRCQNSGEIRVVVTTGSYVFDRASRKTLLEISRELNSQVDEIKRSKKAWRMPSPPFFGITNVGVAGPIEWGDMSGTSLEPSVAGMGLGAILEKPAVKDGQIKIRKMMNVMLLYSHRAMFGDTPIEFLTQLKRNLEEPDIYLV